MKSSVISHNAVSTVQIVPSNLVVKFVLRMLISWYKSPRLLSTDRSSTTISFQPDFSRHVGETSGLRVLFISLSHLRRMVGDVFRHLVYSIESTRDRVPKYFPDRDYSCPDSLGQVLSALVFHLIVRPAIANLGATADNFHAQNYCRLHFGCSRRCP
jgi:hypothetical protein